MATSSLEFTLSLNSGGIAQGMARAREEITSNLRGLSQAARSEGQRIQAALNAITLSENAARRIQETGLTLKPGQIGEQDSKRITTHFPFM